MDAPAKTEQHFSRSQPTGSDCGPRGGEWTSKKVRRGEKAQALLPVDCSRKKWLKGVVLPNPTPPVSSSSYSSPHPQIPSASPPCFHVDLLRATLLPRATMSTTVAPRRGPSSRRSGPASKKPLSDNGVATGSSRPSSPNNQPAAGVNGGERTVKRLRLTKALTIPEGTAVSDACRRMAHRKVDAVLLTDANGLLSGIVTDKDIATRVIAEGLRPDQTLVSKIMTRNPVYVMSDTLAIEALQKMVQGKFRHLPVVENGEVIALLDITKCLYDAISRMEKAAEQGSAIAAAVEGVEHQWGGDNFSAQYAFIETLRERMFKPTLSTIILENTKVALVSPSDPVNVATKKMREQKVNSVVVVMGGKPQGILTSKDVLMRVVAHNLSPELTLVEKVMTASPECATLETTILDALHTMYDGKFLHLPVVDHDGRVVSCTDVLQLTHAAISMVEGVPGGYNDMASTMMQKFWDSALALEPPDEECETRSELSALMASETDTAKSIYPPLGLGNLFYFKFEDNKGRMHRFSCSMESLEELLRAICERSGPGIDRGHTQLLYEDDEGDKILLVTDNDLVGAVNQARSSGQKVLRLHVTSSHDNKKASAPSIETPKSNGLTSLNVGILTGAILVAAICLTVYIKRSNS